MKSLAIFVMMIYGRLDSSSLFDIEGLLLVQESQLDKFRQELATTTIAANVVHTSLACGVPNFASRAHGLSHCTHSRR